MRIENQLHGRKCDNCNKILLYGSNIYKHGNKYFCRYCEKHNPTTYQLKEQSKAQTNRRGYGKFRSIYSTDCCLSVCYSLDSEEAVMTTEGEWKHIENGVIVASDGRQIASVFPRDREINANLIAAAPEMYQALKAIYAYDLDLPAQIINQGWKALAKAEGE